MRKGHKYYYCDNCGAIIEDEDLKICRIKEGDYWHLVSCCPDCKNDAIEEMTNCKMCGALIRDTEDYCEDCKTEVYKIWDEAVEKVMALRDRRGNNSSEWMASRDAFIEYLTDERIID